MKRKTSSQAVTIVLVIIVALILIWVVVWAQGLNSSANTPVATEPPVLSTTEPAIVPTVLAVTKDDVTCYFGDELAYSITVSRLVIVAILEKNGPGDLVKVRLNELIDCWVPLSSLELNKQTLDSLPFSNVSLVIPTSTTIPTSTPLPGGVTPIPPSGLVIQWKISSYDCELGKAKGVTIDLIVSGGVEPYSFSPKLPIYAKPGQDVSVSVRSKTADGDPSGVIKFPVPDATDKTHFGKCQEEVVGNVPAPAPAPIETQAPVVAQPPAETEPPQSTEPPKATEPPVVTDPPPTEPVCYNPQGHEIPCH